MQVLITNSSSGRFSQFLIGWRWISVTCITTFAVMGLVGFSSYHYGKERSVELKISSEQKEQLFISQSLKQKLDKQEENVSLAVRDAQENLNALAMRLGSMQAKVTRLEAAGSRLITEIGLSAEEFNFENAPAIGGTQDPETQRELTVPDFIQTLEALSEKLDDHQQEYSVLDSIILYNKLEAAAIPSGKPVTQGWMSSGYGDRTDPMTGKHDFHKGVDFAGKKGAEVMTVATGVVIWAGEQKGFGKMVEIDHGFGYITRYAHNKENLVNVGDKVEKGQVIGLMGSTGRSTGVHVHFEVVKDGKGVNPAPFLKSNTSS